MYRIVLAAVLLVGCSTISDPVVVDIDPLVIHPYMPNPYVPCNITWKVIDYNNAPYISMTYNDSLNLAICIGDLERYITELHTLTCSYRTKDDTSCIKEPND